MSSALLCVAASTLYTPPLRAVQSGAAEAHAARVTGRVADALGSAIVAATQEEVSA